MNQAKIKINPQPALISSRDEDGDRLNACTAAPALRVAGGVLRLPVVADSAQPVEISADRLSARECAGFLKIIEATSIVNRHYDLFRLLQTEIQYFLPHQVMLAAWIEAGSSAPKLDVVSAIRGVRTARLNGCGIDRLMDQIISGWISGGRRPMLLDDEAAVTVTHSTCHCPLHLAMRSMRSVLVHGIRNERDDLDSVYVALNPVSVKGGQDTGHFLFMIDPLITLVDRAFQKVGALKASCATTGDYAPRKTDSLSAREQEVVRWITEGKTNATIAGILGISSFTVKNHAQRIFRKLDVTNRTEAVAKYRRNNAIGV